MRWTPPSFTTHVPEYFDRKEQPQPKLKEGVIVNHCICALFKMGCYVWRNNTGAWKPRGSDRVIHYGKKGSADIIGVNREGRFIAVECKSGKNRQEDEQIAFQRSVEEKNGIYILAYGVDDLIARQSEIMGYLCQK